MDKSHNAAAFVFLREILRGNCGVSRVARARIFNSAGDWIFRTFLALILLTSFTQVFASSLTPIAYKDAFNGIAAVVIQGMVIAQGKAVSGAKVQIAVNGGRGVGRFIDEMTTDEYGGFQVENHGRYTRLPLKLVVTHPDYLRYVSDWIDASTPIVGHQLIEMNKGVAIDGFVFDAKGNHARNVSVSLSVPEFVNESKSGRVAYRMHAWMENSVALPYSVKTDENGYFNFAEHLSGIFSVTALASDKGSSKQTEALLPGITNPNTQINIHLEDGPSVSGKVYLDGIPAGNIALLWECGQDSSFWFPQLSGEDGSFILKNLEGQGNCAVVAHPANSDSSSLLLLRKNLKTARKGFVRTRIKARVGDKDIKLRIKNEHPGSALISFDGRYSSYHGEFKIIPIGNQASITTSLKKSFYSPTKMFTLENMRPGKYQLISNLRDGKGAKPVTFRIQPDKQTKVTVQVEPGFFRGKAVGRVLDAETKKPIPFAKMNHSERRVTTIGSPIGVDGVFSLDFVGEELSMSIGAAGYKSKRIKIELTESTNTNFGDIYLDKTR